MVGQIVTPRNFIVNLGFVSVDNEFLGVANLLYHSLSYVLFIYCYLPPYNNYIIQEY